MKKNFFGTRKSDNATIYITSPSWECDWYWSFGYLGNKDEHYHLSSFANGRNINMYEALLADYHLSFIGQPDRFGNYPLLFKFCELAYTAYALKNAAAVLGRGGSNFAVNPCKDVIVNTEEVKRINEVVLPAIFDEIDKLFNL